MDDIKAIFVDCDGVLYDKEKLSYHDIAIEAFGKAAAELSVSTKQIQQRHGALKNQDIHGLFNVALSFCRELNVPFRQFAHFMVQHTDYSRIPRDTEMIALLKQIAQQLPVYITTDNTWLHLLTILNHLQGQQKNDILTAFHVMPLTVEDSLYDGWFHPKRVENQMNYLCCQTDHVPKSVLMLDDTPAVCEAAQRQGLQTIQITGPEHTKQILKGLIHEKSNAKSAVPLRQACGRASR